jgi:FkbM family methyltransferase
MGDRAAYPSWGSAAWKNLVRRDLAALRASLGAATCTHWMFPWGMVESGHMDTVVPQMEDIYLNDGYRFEPEGSSPRIIDGGGNIGLSALWFRRAYPEAEVIVYEPDPRLVDTIKVNLAHAGHDDIKIEPSALWTLDGKHSFAGDGDDRGHVCEDGTMTVNCTDIAHAVSGGVDLLKLDIEGAELECLEHLMGTGAIARIRHIIAELHLNQSNTDRALAVLQGLRLHGFALAFDASIAGWLGEESQAAPFAAVRAGKTFVQLFAWSKKGN